MAATATSAASIELELYERFFIEKGLEPYPVQEEALRHIFAGEGVLVTVPTGTGKTLIAKAALLLALRQGKTAIYTTPLRALTEEKHRELVADFGEENVGFATGDYQVNAGAPIQVLVAEILWNRIFADRVHVPADIVVMDEGHYFNEPERGYVWEQSIIGLDPRTQLVILSATIGYPESFCQWVYLTRRVPMRLVKSDERKVPLHHEWREQYLLESVRELAANAEVPAIIFAFSRKGCFEIARLLKSCARFTTDEERQEITVRMDSVLKKQGLGPDLAPLLAHGIGLHHAGVLPAYRRLIEELTADRLLKFVVSTETISAGINLPAKRVVFPSLRKHVKNKARLLLPSEYHQMAGRAGRPQFDKEGIAISLAPEEVIQEFRKEIKDAKRGGLRIDEGKIKLKHYNRAKAEAKARQDVTWDEDAHKKLVSGQPAALRSRTQITAEQILAIGLPDLAKESLPGSALVAEGIKTRDDLEDVAPEVSGGSDPAYLDLNIKRVIDNLLLSEREKVEAHKRLAMITANLRALSVLDEHGRQVKGEIIGKIRGADGPFVYYWLMNVDPAYEDYRQLVEYVIEHDVIQRHFDRKREDVKKAWCRERLRELRRDNPLVAFEDVEAEYDREFPRELLPVEHVHAQFVAGLPHPELHGGKTAKQIWATMEDRGIGFFEFVEEEELATEEGSLFTYLARVMKTARMLHDVTKVDAFGDLEAKVRKELGGIDPRVLKEQ
ncbi:MAG: DEAD/DEAH box helicase [Deltaproteobacteria bacterium]|nr:DEAD/DEAH box helicase [Deltaproteobacteria bacterium]